jgi:hypothetical protein
MNIYLDIETIPGQAEGIKEILAERITAPGNYKKPETILAWEQNEKPALIEEAWLKTSFDGAFGHIAVASIAIGDDTPTTFYSHDWPGGERGILFDLFNVIESVGGREYGGGTRQGVKPVFIGHNVLNFDLRFIFQRAVMLGIRPPACIPFDAKPWGSEVFDTMTAWAGARGTVSLDKLCKVFSIAAKGSEIEDEIDGSKVWEFVQAGRIDDVAKYCAGDVERVRQIYKRLTFAQAA